MGTTVMNSFMAYGIKACSLISLVRYFFKQSSNQWTLLAFISSPGTAIYTEISAISEILTMTPNKSGLFVRNCVIKGVIRYWISPILIWSN
jgi:hypothetical protein